MRNSLREQLEEDGFIVLEDFLTPDETEELYNAGRALCMEAPQENRKIFSTIKAEDSQNRESYFIESGDKVRYFFEDGAVGEKGELLLDPAHALNKVGHALHTENQIFKKLTFCDRVKEVCWQLGYRRPAVPQSMYIYKNPRVGGEVTPHQDAWFLHTEPNSVVGFWFALEDTTVQNGCLQFIKGSHKGGIHRRYIRNPDKSGKELLTYDQPAPTYPLSNFTHLPVKKGTCVIIHGQVVHKSNHNLSQKSRHAYTFHVIETEITKYSEENWLQPPSGKPFPILYETK